MYLRALTFVLLQVTIASAWSQAIPTPLRDGQEVTLTGTLTLEPAGRLQFVTVKTVSAYTPIFIDENHKEVKGETLHEVSLSGYDYRLVYEHRGQQATVTGKVLTDDATPYFWHGTRLEVASLSTAKGFDLKGKSHVRAALPNDLKSYKAGVILHADLALPWTYTVQGKSDSRGSAYTSCGSNGGGDVVNCFCADAFHPVDASSSRRGKHSKGKIFSDMHMAQFDVGDDAVEVHLSVTCSR